MPNNAEYKEIGRVRVSDKVEVVLSEVHRNDKLQGFSLNKYVTSDEYTGFGKGVFIPDDKLIDFLKLFGPEDLQYALDDIPAETGATT